MSSGSESSWRFHHGDVRDAYKSWPQPQMIISDGAYGIGGFEGDPVSVEGLPDWYADHIAHWSELALPSTTLWFWGTELGWATMHPQLAKAGWDYVQAIIWDKGIGHIAGNVNSETIRQFPIVTELCAHYRRRLIIETPDGAVDVRTWLRDEWRRTGLTMHEANIACGVASAATRKYFATDEQWYLTPPEMMQRLVVHANTHGDPSNAPYFCSSDGVPFDAESWAGLIHPWGHTHGLTNVWSVPALHSSERRRSKHGRRESAVLHANQKPTEIMRRIIRAATQPGDVIWEPFGGLCSASVAALETMRRPCASEHNREFAVIAEERLANVTPMLLD